MSTMKHTPGPWHIGMKPGPILYGPKGEQIIDLRTSILPVDEDQANARLIAAAPDLLGELRNAVRCAERDAGSAPGWVRKARAAIAKAIGE